jgi:hypothetical protein
VKIVCAWHGDLRYAASRTGIGITVALFGASSTADGTGASADGSGVGAGASLGVAALPRDARALSTRRASFHTARRGLLSPSSLSTIRSSLRTSRNADASRS